MSSISEGAGKVEVGDALGGGFFILENKAESFGLSVLVTLLPRRFVLFLWLASFLALLLCIMEPKLSLFITAGLWASFFSCQKGRLKNEKG